MTLQCPSPTGFYSFATRCFGAWVLSSLCLVTPSQAQLVETPVVPWSTLTEGSMVLFRHAQAPGVGDPDAFRLGDCATQRNLSAAGRAQAQALGERFRASHVVVGQVLSSRWCRTSDTAELAFPGQVHGEPLFDSFFAERDRADPQTKKARALLLQWRGPGVLVVVTHQVNITPLTNVYPASGEGVVVRAVGGVLKVVGRLTP